MAPPTARHRGGGDGIPIARIAVGGIWLAGAAFNAFVTRRMEDPYGWLADGSPVPIYRWFFGDVVGAHPTAWTVALAAGEATIGALTLCRGRWAQLGLAGGALFSALLFSLATPYTLVMGPYALFLAWLARQEHRWSQVARRRDRHPQPLPA
jgi:hypothetical protein